MTGGGNAGSTGRVEIATFGGGCYWCLEAVYEQVAGVLEVKPGFMGGKVENPTYEQVCRGDTGHAEVVQLKYDPSKTGFEDLLALFWRLHDPTQLNRQGADVGTQYRSVIFTHTDAQREAAEKSKAVESQSGRHSDQVVTQIVPAAVFYPAPEAHRRYYRNNPRQDYCRWVIRPKLQKLGIEQ